jgi:hypothetical protein
VRLLADAIEIVREHLEQRRSTYRTVAFYPRSDYLVAQALSIVIDAAEAQLRATAANDRAEPLAYLLELLESA